MQKFESFKKTESLKSQESILEKETIIGIFKELLAPLTCTSGTNRFPRFAKDIKYLLLLYKEDHYKPSHLQNTNIDHIPDFFFIKLRLVPKFSLYGPLPPEQRRCPPTTEVLGLEPQKCHMLNNSLKSPVLKIHMNFNSVP